MNQNQITAISFTAACALIALLNGNSGAYICLAISIALFGFILWLDRNRLDRAQELQVQINELKNKVEVMQLARTMGR